MNILKKIFLYNSPEKVIERFNNYNTTQKWFFIDIFLMILFSIYFYKIKLLFGMYFCIFFGIISVVGIKIFK